MAKSKQIEKAEPKARRFDELGVSGLTRYGSRSLIYEEFLRQLQPGQAVKVYREMRDNDPIVGAILFATEQMLRNVTWRVEGEDEEGAEFVQSCMDDMSHTWEDFLSEVLSMLTYGWAYHEIVYKRRLGDSNDPTKRSRYDDGKIGWRKLPIRGQDTIQEWEFDEDGGVQAMTQSAPPDYQAISIPIERALLFRTTSHKNSPEGRSILRNAYRPWYFKRRLEEVEGIGVERDLAGLPVIYRDASIADRYDADLKKILTNVRRDEQEGLLLPLAYDESGNKLLEFQLLSSGGSRQFNTTQIVERYNRSIAMTCLADFILLGHEKVGSFALADSKTALFAVALGGFLKSIAAVMNRYAIPRLLAANGMDVEEPPELVPGDLETPDLKEVAAYVSALAGAGAPLFPDDSLESHLREIAHLPPKPEEAATAKSDRFFAGVTKGLKRSRTRKGRAKEE